MDVYSSVKISHYYSKLIGLSPYQLVGKKPGERSYKVSKIGYAHSIVMIITLFALNIMIHAFNWKDPRLSSMSIVGGVIVVQYHADFIVSIFALVRSCVTANRVVLFFRGINRIDKKFKSIKIVVSYAGQRRFAIMQTTFISATILGAFMYVNSTFTPLAKRNTFWWQFFWSFYFVPKLLCAVFHSRFIEGVMVVRTRFKLLNESLESMESDRHCAVKWVEKSQSTGYCNPQSVDFFATSHVELCELAKEHNSIYSFQTLFYIASAFITITTRLNSVVRDTTKKEHLSRLLFVHGIFSLCMLFFYAVQMVCLAVACTLCANEANKTATFVHKHLHHTRNDDVKEKLQLFSLQLLHYKLQFTACQMFPLDATLIYAIVGGVTTYLIILTQFEVSSGESQAKFLINFFNETKT